MKNGSARALKQTHRLLEVVHTLRRRCPWDKKQTHKSLVPYLLEEAYEAIDAIQSKRRESLREELGDLLLQITLHAEISREKGHFDFEDVACSIADKMIRRHPHIYGDARVKNLKAHMRNWTRLKSAEKPKKTMLEGIPRALPALQLSQRYGEIAASVGFDWPSIPDVLDKVAEEMGELKAEIRRRPRRRAALEMELGDLLFVLTRLAGHLNIDAERALRKSARKFSDRFSRLEKETRRRGRRLGDLSLDEMESIWQRIKKHDRARA